MDLIKAGVDTKAPEYRALELKSDAFLEASANQFWSLLVVSFIQLLFPINVMLEKFFITVTKRKGSDISINFFNELILFVVVIWLIYDWNRYYGSYDPDIMFAYRQMNGYQLFSCNILWF